MHPGYGFLAENAGFAARVIDAGLTWVGPPPAAIEQMGDKINARNLMEQAGVPVSAGTREPVADADAALAAGRADRLPGHDQGRGGRRRHRDERRRRRRRSCEAGFETARSRAERFFGSPAILLERYLPAARHVEVQILGPGRRPRCWPWASATARCSAATRRSPRRRRRPASARSCGPRMLAAAVRAGEAVGYRGAGTVEFLVDAAAQEFVFLEMNTRLQVEHPITELVTGIDLVEQQFRIAAGEPPRASARRRAAAAGHAIELRVYAEDPQAVPAQPRHDHRVAGARRRRASGSTPATPRATP